MKEGRESIQDLYNKIVKGYDVINKTDPKLKKKIRKIFHLEKNKTKSTNGAINIRKLIINTIEIY